MKYVLDSNVALKWVLPEVCSAKALRVLDEYTQSIHQLVAPQDILSEVANGLATAERQGRLKPGESAALFLDVLRQAPVIHRSSSLLRPEQWRSPFPGPDRLCTIAFMWHWPRKRAANC